MAEKKQSLLYPDLFEAGALRGLRKAFGTQKYVAARIGVSPTTVSRAERGFKVNYTSAMLEAITLGIIPRGEYDLTRSATRREVLRYMRVSENGRHAKGWETYLSSIGHLSVAA